MLPSPSYDRCMHAWKESPSQVSLLTNLIGNFSLCRNPISTYAPITSKQTPLSSVRKYIITIHHQFSHTMNTHFSAPPLLSIINLASHQLNHHVNHLPITDGPLRSISTSHDICYISCQNGYINKRYHTCPRWINVWKQVMALSKGKSSYLLEPSSPLAMYTCTHVPWCNKWQGHSLGSKRGQGKRVTTQSTLCLCVGACSNVLVWGWGAITTFLEHSSL